MRRRLLILRDPIGALEEQPHPKKIDVKLGFSIIKERALTFTIVKERQGSWERELSCSLTMMRGQSKVIDFRFAKNWRDYLMLGE